MRSTLFLLAAASCALALPHPAPTAPALPPAKGGIAFAGVNIPGFDFSCQTDGTCNVNGISDVASNGLGAQQMNHFVQTGLNAFRLPVGWQYLVNNNLGGPLDPNNFGKYDKLVQGCIASGAKMCMIDM
jgi:endoglucanase